jgi:hypothetical protein
LGGTSVKLLGGVALKLLAGALSFAAVSGQWLVKGAIGRCAA